MAQEQQVQLLARARNEIVGDELSETKTEGESEEDEVYALPKILGTGRNPKSHGSRTRYANEHLVPKEKLFQTPTTTCVD
jgi:hypothetical protein